MLSSKHSAASRRAQSGMSLIEVMIAVLVLSIGLLGMAALQGLSLQNNRNANYRSQATNLSYELADALRGNRDRLDDYTDALADWTATCPDAVEEAAPDECLGTDIDAVDCDIARWTDRLCRELPNGRGRVVGTLGAIAGTTAMGGAFDVQICWADDMRNYEASDDCSGDGETVFSMETSL